jgi:hypothetical protein
MPGWVDRPDAVSPPSAAEVRAVAEQLRVRPEELQSIRLPGPGRTAESVLSLGAPEIDGFGRPQAEWLNTGEPTPRLSSLYRSNDDVFFVVSHEHGPEIYMLLDAVPSALVGAVVGEAVRRFLDWVLRRRGESRPHSGSVRARRRTYDVDGNLISDEEVEIILPDAVSGPKDG